MSPETTTASRSFITPFNIVASIIVLIGLYLTLRRFTGGLGAVTNLSDNNAWGIWIGFDLLTGVALAAGGYVTAAAVYIFGMKKYHSALRPAVLTGFLGYALVVLALHYDVGRPWRLPYPFVVQQGTSSVLFEVGACVALYLTVLFLEFSPAALEWLGLKRARNLAVKFTLALVVFGIILSTLHQSSLGALFLIAPSKLHPLWYSSFIPVYFFVSSIIAGFSMVIFEATISYRFFSSKMDEAHLKEKDDIALGFGKAASYVIAGYIAIQIMGIGADNDWHWLGTGYGLWYLVELLGFFGVSCLLYAVGAREKNVKLIRWTAAWTVLGVIVNRFNVSLIAFNWLLPSSDRYFPSWMEIGISVFLITLGLIAFRFIVSRMPILHELPEYKDSH